MHWTYSVPRHRASSEAEFVAAKERLLEMWETHGTPDVEKQAFARTGALLFSNEANLQLIKSEMTRVRCTDLHCLNDRRGMLVRAAERGDRHALAQLGKITTTLTKKLDDLEQPCGAFLVNGVDCRILIADDCERLSRMEWMSSANVSPVSDRMSVEGSSVTEVQCVRDLRGELDEAVTPPLRVSRPGSAPLRPASSLCDVVKNTIRRVVQPVSSEQRLSHPRPAWEENELASQLRLIEGAEVKHRSLVERQQKTTVVTLTHRIAGVARLVRLQLLEEGDRVALDLQFSRLSSNIGACFKVAGTELSRREALCEQQLRGRRVLCDNVRTKAPSISAIVDLRVRGAAVLHRIRQQRERDVLCVNEGEARPSIVTLYYAMLEPIQELYDFQQNELTQRVTCFMLESAERHVLSQNIFCDFEETQRHAAVDHQGYLLSQMYQKFQLEGACVFQHAALATEEALESDELGSAIRLLHMDAMLRSKESRRRMNISSNEVVRRSNLSCVERERRRHVVHIISLTYLLKLEQKRVVLFNNYLSYTSAAFQRHQLGASLLLVGDAEADVRQAVEAQQLQEHRSLLTVLVGERHTLIRHRFAKDFDCTVSAVMLNAMAEKVAISTRTTLVLEEVGRRQHIVDWVSSAVDMRVTFLRELECLHRASINNDIVSMCRRSIGSSLTRLAMESSLVAAYEATHRRVLADHQLRSRDALMEDYCRGFRANHVTMSSIEMADLLCEEDEAREVVTTREAAERRVLHARSCRAEISLVTVLEAVHTSILVADEVDARSDLALAEATKWDALCSLWSLKIFGLSFAQTTVQTASLCVEEEAERCDVATLEVSSRNAVLLDIARYLLAASEAAKVSTRALISAPRLSNLICLTGGI